MIHTALLIIFIICSYVFSLKSYKYLQKGDFQREHNCIFYACLFSIGMLCVLNEVFGENYITFIEGLVTLKSNALQLVVVNFIFLVTAIGFYLFPMISFSIWVNYLKDIGRK